MFGTVIVANRGEIAVRVIATLKRLGIRSAAVYSDADADAEHVRLADVAVRLGPATPSESYLSIERVVGAANSAGADAVHPGYGFLSENPAFARACADGGLVFIGPPAEAMELLGDKVSAKLAAEGVGVPVVPGLQRPGLTDEEIEDFARGDGGFPLMIKAAAGGGGRGMRVVHEHAELAASLAAARREALGGFGDDSLFVERYVERARHIEIQILADAHGNVIHLGERECSLQRRHQKVVEESPSPIVTEDLRARMGGAACDIARRARYHGAGTVEFLVSAEDVNEFYFLEVNARLQVEHPVTESVTGFDLVEQQLLVAAGQPLAFTQGEVELNGHSIEVRVTAEDAAAGFLPATGPIALYEEPTGPGIRVDSGVVAGSEVTPFYDSLLAKVIASGRDRVEALERLTAALHDLRVLGVTTNVGFLARLIASPQMHSGKLDTGLIERGEVELLPSADERRRAAIAAAAVESASLYAGADASDPWDTLVGFRLDGAAGSDWELKAAGEEEPLTITVEGPPGRARVTAGEEVHELEIIDHGETLTVALDGEASVWHHATVGSQRWVAAGPDAFAFELIEPVVEGSDAAAEGALEAPMPGTILNVRVGPGEEVAEGEVVVVMESMKMELSLSAPRDGVVAQVHVGAGDGVRQGQVLVDLEAAA
jgi:acetyl-CoA/propionyl-CoA carboxylase biotin carboxyl carrier protein